MEGIVIRGRLLHEPTVDPAIGSDGVRIRIDDGKNPEFWLEIDIPIAALLAFVKQCHEIRADEVGDQP